MWYDLNLVHDTFEKAVDKLIRTVKNKKLNITTRARACGILKVAVCIDKEQMVPLLKLFEIYKSELCREMFFLSNCSKPYDDLKYKSSDARDLLMKHLPVVIVYNQTENNNYQASVIKRGTGVQWHKMIEELDWPTKETMLRERISDRLNGLIPKALSYASEKHKHILKHILLKLTSKTFLSTQGIGPLKFQPRSLEHGSHLIESYFDKWDSLSPHEKKKERMKGSRLEGSGRRPLGKVHPELANIMLSLFDSGEGLQSHPRLACETLYRHKTYDYMTMPRCVSILQQVFNIDISLSCAYTYTDNYRSKTNQAARHHEGSDLNPKISLNRPSKDLFNPSINDHYAQTDVNYSLEQAFSNEAVIIARDDKALVHCDVSVVDRPSKSWHNVHYSDHDWEKDTQRSLQITTYQFVKLKDKPRNSSILLSDIPICQTNLTGPGLSLVKTHYFEHSTIFRHFNELLFIMSLDKFKEHFIDKNGHFVSQILLTVDGGPDERPRNKMTQFSCSLLRCLLEMDKVKVISYAEGSSKRHSVERYHVVEGRALSQKGAISSRTQFEHETNDQGLFDQEKFETNMNIARDECISRIDGTPYAGSVMSAMKPHKESDWVIDPHDATNIKEFLSKDTTAHRREKNYVLKPKGPIWEKLCSMYDLERDKTFSCMAVYNDSNDPDFSWQQHYGFATVRKDSSYRAKMSPYDDLNIPVCKFEMQPIVDVGRLPEFHYLSYSQVLMILKYFVDNSLEFPLFFKCPDYYLPSKNIDRLRSDNKQVLEQDDKVDLLSNLLGVSINQINKYVRQKEQKEELEMKKKLVKQSYSCRVIGVLKVPQIKSVLSLCGISYTREQHNRADLLVLLDKEVKRMSMSDEDFLKHIGFSK